MTNLKKVYGARLQAALVDANNFRAMIQNDLPEAKGKVQMNSKMLADKDLVIGFGHGAKGSQRNSILEKGLKAVNAQKIVDEYLSKHLK